jgi:uncharacterized protein with HEPN domain
MRPCRYMSVHDPRATLRQIQDAALRTREICAGKTLEELVNDWRASAALERFIEIIGEGVKRLPSELRDRYPGVPWKEIAGTRDHLSHGYDDVDYQVVMGRGKKRCSQTACDHRSYDQRLGKASIKIFYAAILQETYRLGCQTSLFVSPISLCLNLSLENTP